MREAETDRPPDHWGGPRFVVRGLALAAAWLLFVGAAPAADPPGANTPAAAGTNTGVNTGPNAAANSGKAPASRSVSSRNGPDRFAGRAGRFYEGVWGIDSLTVRLMESGELVRFTYRVLDPARAAPLNDKANEPSLIAPRAGVTLVVPTMEKVGQLRQAIPPEAGRSYWVAFSNKGRPVKKGDRVDVVIGPFHATNLIVD